jgi:hypothetical protein
MTIFFSLDICFNLRINSKIPSHIKLNGDDQPNPYDVDDYEIIANNIFRVLCELDNLSDQVDITKKGA